MYLQARKPDRPAPIKRSLWTVTKWATRGEYTPTQYRAPKNEAEANVIGSQLEQNDPRRAVLHAPALDVDFPCRVLPSSTWGHSHLYIDKAMTWREYKRFLKALVKVGIIEKGYYNAAMNSKQTMLRKPGVSKNPVPVDPLIKIRLQEMQDVLTGIIKDTSSNSTET